VNPAAAHLLAPVGVEPIRVPVLEAPGACIVTPPGSKSLTNRAILLAALARGGSTLRGALTDADDARVMIDAVRTLGAGVSAEGDAVRVAGVGGRWRTPPGGATLDLHNAGTAARFLAGTALLSAEPITIDGNARMRQRPIGELTEVLGTLGSAFEHLGAPGCPPVRITPPAALRHAAAVEVATTQSSQFISALLMAGVFLPGGLALRLTGEGTSGSYVEMTLGLLADLGASVRTSHDGRLVRVGGAGGAPGIDGFSCDIEPDASGATTFWAAGAIVPGLSCAIAGIGKRSLQGDARFPAMLARMGTAVEHGQTDTGAPTTLVRAPDPPGALAPILADMSEMPDAAMALACIACFAGGTSVLRGLRTLRIKECDRVEALRAELAKIGVRAEPPRGDPDALTITPPEGGVDCSAAAARVEFETYDDHRMAMSLALIGLRRPNVYIRNPACVGKTYPGFWRDWAGLYGKAEK